MNPKFEWHKAKAAANWRAHGLSFELATTVFKDPFATELVDDREDCGETHFFTLGMAEGQCCCMWLIANARIVSA